MGKTRTIRVSEETYAKIERRAQAERRSVSNMAEVVLESGIDRFDQFTVYEAPELAEVQSWGPWERAPHESDAEYKARSAVLDRIAGLPDNAPRK